MSTDLYCGGTNDISEPPTVCGRNDCRHTIATLRWQLKDCSAQFDRQQEQLDRNAGQIATLREALSRLIEVHDAMGGMCSPERILAEAALAKEGREMSKQHDSDCAVHNEPAYPAGKCDCSVSKKKQDNGTTHYAGCIQAGPKHYECALQEIGRLRGTITHLRAELEKKAAGTYADGYENGYQAGMAEKKPWVGLTDEEINSIEFPESGTATIKDFVRIIESKLKDKNCG